MCREETADARRKMKPVEADPTNNVVGPFLGSSRCMQDVGVPCLPLFSSELVFKHNISVSIEAIIYFVSIL